MSYSISGSGHNARAQEVQEAFGALVVALDAATDVETGTKFSGSVSGSENSMAFTLTADSVRANIAAAAAADDGEAPA